MTHDKPQAEATARPWIVVNADANAALIVRAVNMHEELIRALQRIADHETRNDRRQRGMVDVSEIEGLQRIARAVLAKAGRE